MRLGDRLPTAPRTYRYKAYFWSSRGGVFFIPPPSIAFGWEPGHCSDMLTRAAVGLGWGRGTLSLSRIFSMTQKRRYWRNTFSTLSSINLTSSSQISVAVQEFLRKCFSDVIFRYFDSKSGQSLKAFRMHMFKAKCNPNTPKDIKLNALQNSYPIFNF